MDRERPRLTDEKRFGIWHSGLTGAYYAGRAKRRKGTTPEQDLWEASGVKHDVTADIEAILRLRGVSNDALAALRTLVDTLERAQTESDDGWRIRVSTFIEAVTAARRVLASYDEN